ncbi:MAG: DUF2993 domain-containing protein [Armatimonadetes bacterium]|nr:DUF2993 domain-containing protein [Armatimonadota bacterium]
MRRAVWLLVGIAALAALWWWVPSSLVQHQLAASIRAQISSPGQLKVKARTTALSLARGHVDRLEIEVRDLPLGKASARRFRARLAGVEMAGPGQGGAAVRSVESGSAELEIGPPDLERLLAAHGIADPAVTIDADGVTATGMVHAGPFGGPARIRGQFYAVSGTELHFRVTSLVVKGEELPPMLANAVLILASQPILSLNGLPVPVRIERVVSEPGRIVVSAQVVGVLR